MKLRLALAAIDEASETAAWLAEQQPARHDAFLEAIADAIQRIRANPRRFPRLESILQLGLRRDIRRCMLRGFPHFVAFEI